MHLNLVSMSKLPPLSLNNFLRSSIWFQYLTFPPVPLIKLLKLPAFIGFQYLYSPGSAARRSLWHIGFPTPLPFCPLLLKFYSSHLCAPLGGIHLVSISKLPPLVPLSNVLHGFIWFQNFPLSSLNNFCTHLNWVSMSKPKLPLSLSNFLRSSGFST